MGRPLWYSRENLHGDVFLTLSFRNWKKLSEIGVETTFPCPWANDCQCAPFFYKPSFLVFRIWDWTLNEPHPENSISDSGQVFTLRLVWETKDAFKDFGYSSLKIASLWFFTLSRKFESKLSLILTHFVFLWRAHKIPYSGSASPRPWPSYRCFRDDNRCFHCLSMDCHRRGVAHPKPHRSTHLKTS